MVTQEDAVGAVVFWIGTEVHKVNWSADAQPGGAAVPVVACEIKGQWLDDNAPRLNGRTGQGAEDKPGGAVFEAARPALGLVAGFRKDPAPRSCVQPLVGRRKGLLVSLGQVGTRSFGR